jgi:gamma-glutamyltranspeptidase / glutathione hydrolase
MTIPSSLSKKPIFATHGVVATSVPLASQIGLSILERGGNAIDAAVAVASALTVLEPTSNGIGGDAFALIWHQGKLYGMNASGPAPQGCSLQALQAAGHTEMPRYGYAPVTVPGAVKGWAALNERFGKFSLIDCLQPAIDAAKHGFPVSPTVAHYWSRAHAIYSKVLHGPLFQPWFDTFTKSGRTPHAGEMMTLKDHARTLELIALSGSDAFYKGVLGEAIDRHSQAHGGFLRLADLMAYEVKWVTPIATEYNGHQIYEIPPNGQGIVALEALGILERLENDNQSKEHRIHQQIEAIKLAFADAFAYVADPQSMPFSPTKLLADSYLHAQAKRIDEHASLPQPGSPNDHGTVYFAVADNRGTMVSYIQSNYMGFGSGIVVPNTGIALHNRGHNFSLQPNHPNVVAPGKRPYHTIIPGFLFQGDIPLGPFGVMGGFMQPQGHVQVLHALIDEKMNPQAALDQPRWQWLKGKQVVVEAHYNKEIVNQLRHRGHDITIEPDAGSFGRGQIILRNPETGVYQAGTESRCDGYIAAY